MPSNAPEGLLEGSFSRARTVAVGSVLSAARCPEVGTWKPLFRVLLSLGPSGAGHIHLYQNLLVWRVYAKVVVVWAVCSMVKVTDKLGPRFRCRML